MKYIYLYNIHQTNFFRIVSFQDQDQNKSRHFKAADVTPITNNHQTTITYFRDINNIFNIPQIFGPKVRKWKRCSVDWVGVAHILWWWHTTSTATRCQVQICRTSVPTSDGMVVPAGDISAQCNVLLCAEMMTADILNTIYTLYSEFYIFLIKPWDVHCDIETVWI